MTGGSFHVHVHFEIHENFTLQLISGGQNELSPVPELWRGPHGIVVVHTTAHCCVSQLTGWSWSCRFVSEPDMQFLISLQDPIWSVGTLVVSQAKILATLVLINDIKWLGT